jgi:hypothetical protein
MLWRKPQQIEAVDATPENLRRSSNPEGNGMKAIVSAIPLSFLLGATGAYAQAASERTIEEIKVETQVRAERGGRNPTQGLLPSAVSAHVPLVGSESSGDGSPIARKRAKPGRRGIDVAALRNR